MLATIIILQIIIVVFLVFLMIKFIAKDKSKAAEDNRLKNELEHSLNVLNNNLSNQFSNKNMENLSILKNMADSIDKKISIQNMEQINNFKNSINTLENKLQKQNSENSEYVKEIITRVTYLDSIKNQMSDLNMNISSLEKVLNDKKARGTFGEIRLKHIFEAVFGEGQDKIYEEQFMLSNGKRVDFMLHGPYPIDNLAIDSKFPLENYLNIVNAENDGDLKLAQRNFKKDLKKHIDDISSKYIIEGETSLQAIMFIPSEAIFSHIHAYDEDIVDYSYKKKVWITSPSTFMAIINLILVVLKDIKRGETYTEIFEEINKLKVEFERFSKRWDGLNKSIEKTYKDTKDLKVTSDKIIKKFDDIEKVNIEKIDGSKEKSFDKKMIDNDSYDFED